MTKNKRTNSKNRYHWIIYHLEAMNYAKTKLEKKLSELPSAHKLLKLDAEDLRKVISKLREIIRWYKHIIDYHQQKAMSHIPETEKTRWAKKMRELENKSYENLFVRGDEIFSDTTDVNFKTYEK